MFFISAAWWASLLLYLAGKMCSSYGVFSVYVVAMEVFPTTSRNSLTNLANTVGRLGSVLAPQAPLLVSTISHFKWHLHSCRLPLSSSIPIGNRDDMCLAFILIELRFKSQIHKVIAQPQCSNSLTFDLRLTNFAFLTLTQPSLTQS